MPRTPGPIRYEVHGRYEYWAVDAYGKDGLIETIDLFKTKKQANLIAMALNVAFRDGVLYGAMQATEQAAAI